MTPAKSNQLVHSRSSNDSFGLRHYFKAKTVSHSNKPPNPRPSKQLKNVRLWTGTTGKQPYAIALADRRIMALAGIWENWQSPAGEWIRTFAIITTPPNELCAELHNRMPAVLKPDAWPVWLGEQPADAPQLKALLAPYPSDGMTCWPVSPRVGNVKDNNPSLIEPIAGS
jgi:putative SOS response-associated peptidase YedK